MSSDPMQVDQNSASLLGMKHTDMVSQESVAGTSNVPAVSEKSVDDQLPDVMIEMRIRDERNANREEKVSCLVRSYHLASSCIYIYIYIILISIGFV